MIAFEIKINEEKFATAGFDDWGLLHVHVLAHRGRGPNGENEYEISADGLANQAAPGKYEHVRWGKHALSIGDEVTLRLVDIPSADAPLKRYRSDKTVQESSYTEDEIREMQWQSYLKLKEIFEGSDSSNKSSERTR